MRMASTIDSMESSKSLRKATNVTLDETLLAKARQLKINVSQAAEFGLKQAEAARRARAWLEENREALDCYNRYIEEQGLPLERYR